MDKIRVLDYLENSDLSIIEDVDYENTLVVKVFYEFDEAEINAAKCYANEETDFDENSIEWIGNGIVPYLDDIAQDSVEEIMEDLVVDLNLEVEFISREISKENYEYKEFLLAIASEEDDLDIDKIMYDLNI
ncbi:MAG: hypothetical protein Q4B63_07325 [Clostridium perfringens]|nr:hypothetical protein [Clostridium perfringens]